MKKRISLLLAVIMLASLCLSSCLDFDLPISGISDLLKPDILDSLKLDLIAEAYRKSFYFISENNAQTASTDQTDDESDIVLANEAAPMPAPRPWDKSLTVVGWVNSGIIACDEDIELNFKLRANDNVLSNVDLHIVFETDDYAVSCDGATMDGNTLIFENFFDKEENKSDVNKTVTLSKSFTDSWACRYISIGVRFVPHDIAEFQDRYDLSDYYYDTGTDFLGEYGYIPLYSTAISYCSDSAETWLRYSTSYGDVINDMSTYHYEKRMISTEEMAALTFGFKYQDCVCTDTSTMTDDSGSMQIRYYSKNIRYESSYPVNDKQLSDAIAAHEEFWKTQHYQPAKGGLDIALRMLELMRERGVITEEEYQNELIWLDEALGVYYHHSGNSSKYDEVNAYKITHND